MKPPTFSLSATVLDSRKPAELARFYQKLLGWPIAAEDATWVMLRAPGGAGLSFQLEPLYAAPTWPSREGVQQLQMHLDIGVVDLEAAVTHAIGLGAEVAEFQPQEDVRVLLDPDGHPFCLFVTVATP